MHQTDSENLAMVAPQTAHRELRSDAVRGTRRDVVLFGLKVTNTTMPDAVSWIIRRARDRQKTLLNFVNAHCLNTAHRHAAYRRVLERSDRLLPDGSGVKLALWHRTGDDVSHTA